MTSYETLTVAKDDGIAWVSLDRPEVRNAINKRMQAELRGAPRRDLIPRQIAAATLVATVAGLSQQRYRTT